MDSRCSYNLKRLGIFLKGLIPGLLFLPFPTVKNRVIFSSTRNEHYNFNSKFLFEYSLNNRKDLSAFFVVNDDRKRERLNKEIGPYFIQTKSFMGIWFVLRARFWFTSSMETPVGGLLHRLKRTVVQLGHGAPLKNIGLLEKNISIIKRIYYRLMASNFTFFLAVSDYFKPVIAGFAGVPEHRVIVNEQPRNEILLKQKRDVYKESLDSFRILYAPTWKPWSRDCDLGMLNGENFKLLDDFLSENNAVLFLRMHPYFESIDLYEKVSHSKALRVLSSGDVPEVNDVLGAFDALITDYSSIFFDYLLLDRPIVFWSEDISVYEERIGFVDSFSKLAAGPIVSDIETLMSVLEKILQCGETFKEYRSPVIKLLEVDRTDICSTLLEKAGV